MQRMDNAEPGERVLTERRIFVIVKKRGGVCMNFQVGEVIRLKKAHPCGANQWKILRVGMDFRLECGGCGRQVMVPRKLVEKNFRGYEKSS